MPPRLALTLALGALGAHLVAVAGVDTADCCPTCAAWQGDCPTGDWPGQSNFTGSHACRAACYGSCLLNPDAATWTCVPEACAPDPCSFDASGRALGTKHVGYCKASGNWSLAPPKSAGIPGAFATAVRMSTHLRFSGEHVLAGAVGLNGGGSDVFRRVFGNRVYWLQPKAGTSAYLLHEVGDEGQAPFVYDINMGSDGDKVNYAVSDEYVLVGRQETYTVVYHAYKAGEAATEVSQQAKVPWDIAYYNYRPHWPQLYHRTGVVITPTFGGPRPALAYWDVEAPDTSLRFVNISVADCSWPGSENELDQYEEWRVMCPEDLAAARDPTGPPPNTRKGGDLSGCRLFFGAVGPLSAENTDLCVMDIDTGRVSPLAASQPKVTAMQNALMWFPFGAVFPVGSAGAGGPTQGDTMVFEFASKRFRWVNDEIQAEVSRSYAFAPAFINFHQAARVSSPYDLGLVADVLVYRIEPSIALPGLFAFNLTSKRVYPIALPYSVPNTVCGRYCYGGSCQVCSEPAVFGYDSVMPLRNGSLVVWRASNDPAFGVEQYAFVRLDSSFILPSKRCAGGCATQGGICIDGQCLCSPGCTGADCSGGDPSCADPAPPPPSKDDDDDP